MRSVSEPLSVVVSTLKTVTNLRGVVWEGEGLGSDSSCAFNRQIWGKPQKSATADLSFFICRMGGLSGEFLWPLPLAHRVNSDPSHTFPWNGTCGTCVSMCPRAPEAAEALVCEGELVILPTGWLPTTGAEVGAGFKPQPPLSALLFFFSLCFHTSQP